MIKLIEEILILAGVTLLAVIIFKLLMIILGAMAWT